MTETSSQITQSMPPEIRGWNWGAFLLNWIWGIGNNVFISLLVFVPVVGIFMPFVLGAKGNEWAWKKNQWQGVEHFKKVQRTWAIVGAAVLVAIVIFAFAIIFAVTAALKSSDVYIDAFNIVQKSPQAVAILGEPISDGLFPSGSIRIDGPSGNASLSFSVKGPKGKATIYLEATKHFGKWNFTELSLQRKDTGEQVPLLH